MPKLWSVGDEFNIGGERWKVVAKCDPHPYYPESTWFDVINFRGQRKMWCPWPEGRE